SKCDHAFSRNDTLKKHIMRIHSGENPYQCGQCENNFILKSELKVHMRTHSGDSLTNHPETHNGDKKYICRVCNKTYLNEYNLISHLRLHNEEKLYQCSHCDKDFLFKSQLIIHLNTHTGEKPY
ncbi:unnamed protein product, partial [Meganyctiphanes norvegica]